MPRSSAPNVVTLREFRNLRREQQEHKKRITKDAIIDRVRAHRSPRCIRRQGVVDLAQTVVERAIMDRQ